MTTELKTGRSTAVIASEGAELKSLVGAAILPTGARHLPCFFLQ